MREPEFVAAAEIMRTRLLAPVNEPRRENERAKRPAGFANQSWGIAAVGADRSSFSGSGATVAVLDTGIDAEHPAFWGVDLVQKDFTGLGNGDHDGHGTHCAGTFFGRDVDGVRIGIARGVQTALIGRVLGPEGGDTNMLARAIHWAHEEGARVVAMPLGFDFPGTIKERIEQGWPDSLAVSIALESYRANVRLFESLLMMTRMQEPLTGGLLVVTAVGDDSQRSAKGDFVVSAGLPLAADATISVGALDPDPAGTGYRVSNFSNYGATISAPGTRHHFRRRRGRAGRARAAPARPARMSPASRRCGGNRSARRICRPMPAPFAPGSWRAPRGAVLPPTCRTPSAAPAASALRRKALPNRRRATSGGTSAMPACLRPIRAFSINAPGNRWDFSKLRFWRLPLEEYR